MKPLISIIIPTYNRANLLVKAIKSVFSQTYKNFELIIVNDGSTDNTKQIIDNFKKQTNKIKYIWEINSGTAKAKNTGIKNTEGKYIAFLDSDDEWLPKKLEKQLELFKKSTNSNLGFVGCNTFIIDKKNNKKLIYKIPKYKNIFYALLINNFICSCSSVMVKKSVLDKIDFFDENLKIGEDWDMWIRIAQKYNFDFVNEPLLKYNIHSGNLSSAFAIEKKEKNIQSIFDKYKEYFENNPKLYSSKLRYDGTRYTLSNDLKKARKSFIFSIKLNPLNYKSYFYFFCSLLGQHTYEYLAKTKAKIKNYKFSNRN